MIRKAMIQPHGSEVTKFPPAGNAVGTRSNDVFLTMRHAP
jgi:hypothetical protein